MPSTIRLQVGPPASATGWIYQYALVGSSRMPLSIGRQLQDELLRPALQSIPDLAEVASVGESTEQVLVQSNVDQLRARGIRIVAANPARLDAIGTELQKWVTHLPQTKSAVLDSLA